ncbi:SDR family NAD(P)-dependent oxidoreductase [Pseudooceanicola sp.]|uniref:SDR family NAD(P)-dependent oxidoreductase n=1 Tax=Pseudooceanicola sp. TaxID=1914328 RepID=UPI0035130144
MSNADLAGRTILITGAGGALGRATAQALSALSADLVLADLSVEALEGTLEKCPGAKGFVGDVADGKTVEKLADFSAQAFDRPVRGLVATAGLFGPMKPLIDVTEDEFDSLFNLNVRAVWRICKAIIPQMKIGGAGEVVLFSSTAGMQASADVPLYSVTKAAVVMMTRTLALSHADQNIRINCVCPGSIAGPMLESSIAFANGPEAQAERRRRIAAVHPMGRMGEPDEVAAAVSYLLGDAASFTTGIALPIDGGRLA